MMLTRTALFSLYGIFNFVGLLQARTACSSNKPICKCRSTSSAQRQQYQKVDCSRRNLTTLPNGIPEEVVELYLTGNDIEDAPKLDFKNLPKLELLELAGNKITSINNGDFADLKALKYLGLSSNNITSIDEGDFTNLEALKNVDLSNNPIKKISPKAFAGLRNLSTINLEAVRMPCGCMLRDFYNWAASYKQGGITIRVYVCNVSVTGQKIPFNVSDYADCDQTTGDGLACAGKNPVCNCTQTEVECNGRELDEFPKEIPVETTVLNLGFNSIVVVPKKELTKLVNLVALDLQSNEIAAFDWTALSHLPNLAGINLSNNPLQCGCSDVPFFQRLHANLTLATTFFGNPTCANYKANTHLKDLDLTASPFDQCTDTTVPTTEPPVPTPWTQCMSCIKLNALTDDECDANGSIRPCGNYESSCKVEFKFTNKGYWALEKSCSKAFCTNQQQPAPCIHQQNNGFNELDGSCTMCCGGNLCNEQYEEIKSYLKNAVFKLKLKLKDATNANPTEIQAAIVKVVNASKLPGRVIQPPTFKIEGSEGFVTVNATFLRGYMDTIQKSLKVTIRQGVDKDPVLKKEINPDSEIEIWTTEYCPPEETFDDLKGNYSWPATKGSATSRLECRNGTAGQKAIRKCLYESSTVSGEIVPAWGDPDLSHCAYMSKTTEALNTLTKLPISNVTVNAISKQLAAVSASAKNVADVSLSTEVIENLVNSDAAFDQHNVENTTKNVVASISNLLDVDFNTMKGADSARRLVTSIDTLIKKIPLNPGQEIGVVENNIALTLVDTTTGKADRGLQYGVTAKPDYPQFNDTNVGLGKRGASYKTSINLPAGLFKDKAVTKASFVGYKSDMLFELMASDTSSSVISDKKFKTTSNSMVLAATLDQPVSGLTGSDLIDMKFEHTQKKLADNPRCTWWDHAANGGNGTWSTKGCTVGATEARVTTCKCDHLTNFALLMDVYGSNSAMSTSHQQALTIVSITGCTLSAVALIFTIFTYVFFRRKLLKDNPSKILMNLCAALLCLNLVFLGGTHYQVDDGACKAVAVLLHYFLIAGFTWMGVEAFYMYLALVKVFQPYFSKLILKCCLVGWGLPLVIVAITIGVNKTDNYYLKAGQICWIRDIPFYGAIVAPVCAILVVNVIAFIMVVNQLRQLTLRKKLTKVDKAHTTTMTQLRGAVSVLVLLGLTWLFAFLSIGDASLAFAYIFAILNTLQGLWIFVFYCLLKKDVQHAWMRKLICCPTPEDSRSSKGKYTLDHRNTGKALKGSEGSGNQSDSIGVTLATYKRVSTDTGQPLSLYKPANLQSGMPGVSPCGPFPSSEDFKPRKDSSSSSATTTTRISSAASIKSKKSIASNTTVCTTLSSETDDSTHEKPTDDNSNTTSFENPAFSRSISDPADQAPTEQQPSARAEPTGDKNYKWEVKPQTGFVDSRGFTRPT